MPQLTEFCHVVGWVGKFDGGREKSVKFHRVPCRRVPTSEMDKIAASLSAANTGSTPSEYFRSQARLSTAVFQIPKWVQVLEGDEIHHGRRTDVTGATKPFIWTIAGIRDYGDFAYQDTVMLFCDRSQ
jgi:hypothetical protein